jgi:subtilisin family serine protease
MVSAVALPASRAGAAPLPDTGADGEWWFVAWDVPKIWNLGAQGQGITVAVLDSGVNPAVAGLGSVLGPGIDIATGSGDGRTDRDPDQSGHGTRMTAFIGGQSGEVGVAPRARILPVVVNAGEGDPATLFAQGTRWAVDHGARVVNLSQGSPASSCPPQLQEAVVYAVRKGAVVVASAGNDGNGANLPEYPANCLGVLSVGAVDVGRHVWPGSQRQPYVDVAAPGVHMRAVDDHGSQGFSEGTSDSAALVSGALALVWSKYPHLSNRQVVARILATLKDDADQPGSDPATGGGIVRPYPAIIQRVPATAPNPVFDELPRLPSPGGTPASSRPAPVPSGCTAGPAACQPGAGSGGSGSNGGGLGTPLLVGVLAAALLAGGAALAMLRASRRRRAAGGPAYQAWPAPPSSQPPGSPGQPPGWPAPPPPGPPQPPPGERSGWPAGPPGQPSRWPPPPPGPPQDWPPRA